MKHDVRFISAGLKLAGHLYLPDGLRPGEKRAAIVVTHPMTGIKEQTAGLYARALAQAGFVALAFDAAYQGESEGEPRFLENPYQRAEDVKAAVSFLSGRAEVDAERIGALGICAGGGYTVFAARTDRRIKAVATVSAACGGSFFRDGLSHTQTPEGLQALFDAAAADRNAQARGEAATAWPILPMSAEAAAPAPDLLREAYDYYRTPRARHDNAPNLVAVASFDTLIGFDAFERIAMISPRPLLMIAGSKADTRYYSQGAIDRAGGPKELFLIDGATHIDLYDREEYVIPAQEKLKGFFAAHLG